MLDLIDEGLGHAHMLLVPETVIEQPTLETTLQLTAVHAHGRAHFC